MTHPGASTAPGGHHRREGIAGARRLVVKVGSSSLTTPGGDIDDGRVTALADALAGRAGRGSQVVLVSSGAIASGLAPLGLSRRPRDLATQQAAASVGQGILIARYTAAFGRHGIRTGQVLLTADDLMRRAHYRNAQRTLERLLGLGVLPVVNENDTVATDEIRFGDNDRLAALVAHVVKADALVLLSDVDGLYDGDPRLAGARKITEVRGPDDLAGVSLGLDQSRSRNSPRGSDASGSDAPGSGTPGSGTPESCAVGLDERESIGTGGMATKVESALIASSAGIPVVVAAAGQAAAALAGEPVGTYFAPGQRRPAPRQLWLAHAAVGRGRLRLDSGAVRAVVGRRASLLPAGVVGVDGDFEAGDPVDLCDQSGSVIARGIASYDAAEIPALMGRTTRSLAAELGPAYQRELVHRDDLVVLG